MLYDICLEQNRTCYITCAMLYNMCHVITYVMLCYMTYVQNRTEHVI